MLKGFATFRMNELQSSEIQTQAQTQTARRTFDANTRLSSAIGIHDFEFRRPGYTTPIERSWMHVSGFCLSAWPNG